MSVLDLTLQTGADEPPLTAEESDAIRLALWRLLEKRVRYDTMGDSSSVPVERAEALFESLCYTLLLHLRERALPRRALLEPEKLLDDAFATIERKLARANALYRAACMLEPPVLSVAWRDTLRGVGAFFRRYDYRVLAHEVPGDIDYPLCLPTPESLPGVSYISEYLRRFLLEAELMTRLDRRLMRRLLHRFSPDPEGLLVNLYEPVMANAVGAALCGLSARALDAPVSAGSALDARTASAVREKLAHAALSAADELCLRGEARNYFALAASQLAPRLLAALEAGDLSHVFTPLC